MYCVDTFFFLSISCHDYELNRLMNLLWDSIHFFSFIHFYSLQYSLCFWIWILTLQAEVQWCLVKIDVKITFLFYFKVNLQFLENIFKILKNPLWTVCNYLTELFLILSFLSITIFTNKIVYTRSWKILKIEIFPSIHFYSLQYSLYFESGSLLRINVLELHLSTHLY